MLGSVLKSCGKRSLYSIIMSDTMWSFGYGSNMDVNALMTKKHVKVIEHTAAVLKGHKLGFNLKGIHHVEPAFAGLVESISDEVHGVAFCMTADSVAELDRTESGYNKKSVTLVSYDGRKLNGFVYMNKHPPGPELLPSSRYLGVLVKGAKQAGLNAKYIEKLSSHPTYKANKATLAARKERPTPNKLKEISVEELAQNKSWVSCLGYVIEPGTIYFGSHKGRDITSRSLMQYHGIPLDDNDDNGQPPYPLIIDLQQGEMEFITCWLDHYALNPDDSVKPIVGYLKEFKEQQSSETTSFLLPSLQ